MIAAIAAGSQPNPQATSRHAASAASGQRAPNSRPATTARMRRSSRMAGCFGHQAIARNGCVFRLSLGIATTFPLDRLTATQ